MYISRHTWSKDGFMLLWEIDLHLRAVTFRGGKGRALSAPSTATAVKLMLGLLNPTRALGTTEEMFHTHPSLLSPQSPKQNRLEEIKESRSR